MVSCFTRPTGRGSIALLLEPSNVHANRAISPPKHPGEAQRCMPTAFNRTNTALVMLIDTNKNDTVVLERRTSGFEEDKPERLFYTRYATTATAANRHAGRYLVSEVKDGAVATAADVTVTLGAEGGRAPVPAERPPADGARYEVSRPHAVGPIFVVGCETAGMTVTASDQ